jgi:hypothetical protein
MEKAAAVVATAAGESALEGRAVCSVLYSKSSSQKASECSNEERIKTEGGIAKSRALVEAKWDLQLKEIEQ